LGNF
jgi:predicted ribosome-associated RNA-binding protein Tma20